MLFVKFNCGMLHILNYRSFLILTNIGYMACTYRTNTLEAMHLYAHIHSPIINLFTKKLIFFLFYLQTHIQICIIFIFKYLNKEKM